MLTVELGRPLTLTSTLADPTLVSQGIWKLIWVELAYSTGAETPFTCTETPPKLGAMGRVDAVASKPVPVKSAPNTVASAPGENFGVKLAAFPTPPLAIEG